MLSRPKAKSTGILPKAIAGVAGYAALTGLAAAFAALGAKVLEGTELMLEPSEAAGIASAGTAVLTLPFAASGALVSWVGGDTLLNMCIRNEETMTILILLGVNVFFALTSGAWASAMDLDVTPFMACSSLGAGIIELVMLIGLATKDHKLFSGPAKTLLLLGKGLGIDLLLTAITSASAGIGGAIFNNTPLYKTIGDGEKLDLALLTKDSAIGGASLSTPFVILVAGITLFTKEQGNCCKTGSRLGLLSNRLILASLSLLFSIAAAAAALSWSGEGFGNSEAVAITMGAVLSNTVLLLADLATECSMNKFDLEAGDDNAHSLLADADPFGADPFS